MDTRWYKDAIIYETHVRAFYDSSKNGNGDFRGLTQKLDYLKDLGINCIWLLPFYPSPLRDDGYDISDYKSINPLYGTFNDFRVFIRESHKRDIRVITELVINHTSDQHPWFQAARRARPGSARRNYYVWSDTDQKYKDARIIFSDSETSNWTWDPVAGAYYWHRFFYHQPDLNYDNPAVLRSIMKALHFWLDQDVDGFRLDAVPYLKEAEGTSCENIPETHTILKEIRRQVDLKYQDRMLLAEANQWPEDVLPYFGNGDECHMAFHFPLMPRIFMALRQEDRHPITDIMRLTPEIPDASQWALFLRNHDELTLEMVTDEERDYMYSAYAADPKMRLNFGIRRRLAPLVENSRRRMELLNSLLFSFKGTPIIYYGDEIGMGDNFHLGDRNGVRTPMQWNSDRNAGFSKADFANLYSPPILDPVYGYQAVNVEAQQRDPSSLLNWMKRLIALRNRFQVFGRGTIEFLLPKNRRVLVYLRTYQEDIVLCVANLSRYVQPVELDLSRFEGLTPCEMFGRTEFPRIGKQPYFLTLAPHAFYWFQLQRVPETISIRVIPPVEETKELPLVEVAGTWDMFYRKPLLTQTGLNVLQDFILKQHWFSSDSKDVNQVRVEDRIFLDTARTLTWIAITKVETNGSSEIYSMPLAIAPRNSPAKESAIARVKSSNDEAFLIDALNDNVVCEGLLQAIRDNFEAQAKYGIFRARGFPELGQRMKSLKKPWKITRMVGEQSNTSIIFGDQMILKFFRRLEPGPNPDLELLQFLNQKSMFDRTPTLLGTMEYAHGEMGTYTVGVLETLVPNQGSAWIHTLNELNLYYERVGGLTAPSTYTPISLCNAAQLMDFEVSTDLHDWIGSYLEEASLLGKRTADLHHALTADTDDPAFGQQALTDQNILEIKKQIAEHVQIAFQDLRRNLEQVAEPNRSSAVHILDQEEQLMKRLRTLHPEHDYGAKIRIHGDYHLGQILWVKNDFSVIDFEGETIRPISERRLKQPALKDVAGMIQSFHYAAFAELAAFSAKGGMDFKLLEPWARLWRQAVASTFLKSYRKETGMASFVPTENESLLSLLECLMLDKALSQLQYELAHRPDWAWIPLIAIGDCS